MTYKRDIELVFDLASFQAHKASSRIDLRYIADNRERKPAPRTIEKEFFLHCIRDHVRSLPQNRTKIPELLAMVGAGWDKARLVSSLISRVNVTFPTAVARTTDSSIAIISSLLLVPLRTKVEVTLGLHGRGDLGGVDVGMSVEARVVYGEQFNVSKMGEFLATRIGERVKTESEDWSDVVVELQQKLLAKGTK